MNNENNEDIEYKEKVKRTEKEVLSLLKYVVENKDSIKKVEVLNELDNLIDEENKIYFTSFTVDSFDKFKDILKNNTIQNYDEISFLTNGSIDSLIDKVKNNEENYSFELIEKKIKQKNIERKKSRLLYLSSQGNIDEVIKLSKEIEDLTLNENEEEIYSLVDMLNEGLSDEEIIEYDSQFNIEKISLNDELINRLFGGGVTQGGLDMYIADTNGGKTMTLNGHIKDFSYPSDGKSKEQINSYSISFEQNAQQNLKKVIQNINNIDNLADMDNAQAMDIILEKRRNKTLKLPINNYYSKTDSISSKDFESFFRVIEKKKGITPKKSIVISDYLQRHESFNVSNKEEHLFNYQLATEMISLAKNKDFGFLTAWQASRRKDKTRLVELEDISASYKVTNLASNIIGLNTFEIELSDGSFVEIQVRRSLKSKSNSIGGVVLFKFNRKYLRYEHIVSMKDIERENLEGENREIFLKTILMIKERANDFNPRNMGMRNIYGVNFLNNVFSDFNNHKESQNKEIKKFVKEGKLSKKIKKNNEVNLTDKEVEEQFEKLIQEGKIEEEYARLTYSQPKKSRINMMRYEIEKESQIEKVPTMTNVKSSQKEIDFT